MRTVEHDFNCPYCAAPISMVLDLSVAAYDGDVQSYIEDCEVCCNPIRIFYTTDGTAVTSFEAQGIEQ